MHDKIIFLSDLIGHELSDYVLHECYYLVRQVSGRLKKAENTVLVVNSNNTQVYCSDSSVIEFLKRICCYAGNTIKIDDVLMRRRLVLLNKETGLGFFFHSDAAKTKIYTQFEIMQIIESDEDAFRWERLDKV